MELALAPMVFTGGILVSSAFFMLGVLLSSLSLLIASKVFTPLTFKQSATIVFLSSLASLLPLGPVLSFIILLLLIRLIGNIKIFFDGILLLVLQIFVMIGFNQAIHKLVGA